MLLKPGDIVATRGKSWVSKAIRFFTRSIGESRTKVNHIGIITIGGAVTVAQITEALSTVQQHSLWGKYGPPKGDDIAIFRYRPLSPEQAAGIQKGAQTELGKRYGYLKIAAHVADYLLFNVYLFRRLCRMKNYPICSWLAAWLFKKNVNYEFGMPYEEVSPDDMWDWMNGHPLEWEVIWPLGQLHE